MKTLVLLALLALVLTAIPATASPTPRLQLQPASPGHCDVFADGFVDWTIKPGLVTIAPRPWSLTADCGGS